MQIKPVTLAAGVFAALVASAGTSNAQLPGAFIQQNVSTYGCATLGSQKWCTPARWSFRQYLEFPNYLDFSVAFPGKCQFHSSGALQPWDKTLPDCRLFRVLIPDIPDFYFEPYRGVLVNTTSGSWRFCDLSIGCAESPRRLTRVTSIQSYWTAIDRRGWETASWKITYSVTPEPATMTLLGTGVAGIAGAAWRRRTRRDA
ncbi:MAG TPA: PEP-CTERM sorting domain-containing protein [Gemmatimonadaceae bacterium]|jgi:hypothetical protein|nr:PEP-CTERM sorting domain-containing protein [Gemmatimonadota bacterium]HNV75637.1 PEP-CTERM sorting domain-containing protein [Gemmatimonadaceae bacterium]HPV76805.1 PEP-CTERM sorting domain-containing protein [Gemmatimonadaceae bacterium]